MKVALLCVGRVRGPLAAAIDEYEERAARYWKLEVVEVAAGAPGSSPSPERVRACEAERLLARVPESLDVVALTRAGKRLDSVRLARDLGERAVRSSPGVAYLIGGAFGLGDDVLTRSVLRLSLSPMTLTHEMARLLLAEQLYRAGTILRGEPYHKG